ncbi:hypothetical protein [Marinobacter changyiensis]|uniref:hypothetical protein n=1 Tax=Marinobacter changyiensis TaxID=2604091 RepID=UPI0012643510|nr:hypothetical protein [Marinobacter changyiensis]
MTNVKQGTFKKKLLAIAVLASAMAMTACSGGSSSSSDDAPSEPTGESTGVAYDGYLRGATVCVDENLNNACDDQRSTTTIKGGVYRLTGLDASQLLYPLALEAKADVTLDEDTGEAVSDGFIYVAPAGAKTVSAFSTIIQGETERRIAAGETPAQAQAAAKAKLATDLGISADIDLTDFDAVAVSKANEKNSDVALQLRVLNQVATQQLIRTVKSAPAGSDPSATLYVATQNVNAKMADTQSLVKTKLAGKNHIDIEVAEMVSIARDTAQDTSVKVGLVTAAAVIAALDLREDVKQKILDTIEKAQDAPATGATGGTGASGTSGVN